MKHLIAVICAVADLAGLAGCAFAHSADDSPDKSTADAAEQGTRLILLGTGGGPGLREKRSQPASLLVVDGHYYLIDCGEGTVGQLRKLGIGPADISGIFLTHLHFDHVAGLASLIGFNWTSGSASRMFEIVGPPGTTKLVQGAESYLKVPEALFAAVLPAQPSVSATIRPRDVIAKERRLVFWDDRIRVFAVANSHYSAVAVHAQDYGTPLSYAYRIETPDRTLVFTGDTGPSEEVTALATGADMLISEVIDIEKTVALIKRKYRDTPADALEKLIDHQMQEHLMPEEIGKMATKAEVDLVVLNHVLPGSDEEKSPLPYLTGVRKFFDGVVVAGKDLEEF